VVAPVTLAWPHGRFAAVVITVAFEAELAILAVAPDATDRTKSLSVGSYGATRGVPRLLAELARRGTPSTGLANPPDHPVEVFQRIIGETTA
jgi:hypothetical protein